MKLFCISVGTVNGYAAVTHSRQNLVFGFMALCAVANQIFFYSLMYEKQFAIPDGSNKVKRSLINGIQKCGKKRVVNKVSL